MPSDGGAGKGRAGWTGVAQRRLRRIIISQLRILGIVGFPIPTYDAQIVHLAEAEGISLGLRLASSRYLSGYERGNSGKKFTFTYNLSMNPSEIEMFLEIPSRYDGARKLKDAVPECRHLASYLLSSILCMLLKSPACSA